MSIIEYKPENHSHENEWDKSSLQLMYELTSTFSTSENSTQAIENMLSIIAASFNAQAAILRLINDDGWMNLSASVGLSENQKESIQNTTIDSFLFKRVAANSYSRVNQTVASLLIHDSEMEMLAVPVRQNNTTLGTLNLLYDSKELQISDETDQLLVLTGEILGQAVEKQRGEAELRQKLIQEERNMIANELHDSLAQTLASLRFQVRILDETLQLSSDYSTINSIEQVEHGLDEAYTDLRELIAHCRAPIEQQGLIALIENLVAKFREETGMHVLLQCECQVDDLPPRMEMNAYRIVQESLTNIKKHSEAHIVRVLLSGDDKGNYRILIENDGEGFDKESIESTESRHLGLTIMQERAQQLGGKLRIESEPEEGTRVDLRFKYIREQTS